jgi:neutral ceramidase
MAAGHGTLRAGAGIAEITPPLEVGILMSSLERRWAPFAGVRRPLHARAVVIERGARRVGLVSLDVLGISGRAFGGMPHFKRLVLAGVGHGLRPADLILAATHTHSGPETLALSDLYRTPAFQDWLPLLAARTGAALQNAIAALRPCRLEVGIGSAPGLSLYRRILTTEGIVLSHPPPPPEKVISREGPVDDSVPVAAFRGEAGPPVALLVNATCHPVHEMCLPQISPDYPGAMSRDLERQYPDAVALFLNGAAGNINPPTVSGGPDDADRHGRRLAASVTEALRYLRPVAGEALTLHRRKVVLPARTVRGATAARPLAAQIAALQIGDALWVFLPGEPFVETGLAIRAQSPFAFTAVVGYAEDGIGYIPTDRAFDEGGYEIGPGRWSRLARGSEPILRQAALELVREMAESQQGG